MPISKNDNHHICVSTMPISKNDNHHICVLIWFLFVFAVKVSLHLPKKIYCVLLNT